MSTAALALNDEPSMLDAALDLARCGFAVFPCHTVRVDGSCSCGKSPCPDAGKHPACAHGLRNATTDAAEIRRLWAAAPAGVDFNVAIVTGEASRVVVVDLDLKEGVDGRAALAALAAEHGALPATLSATTGSGGQHLFFRSPGTKITNSAGKLGPGIDVRGDGGYVIATPSIHRSGARYAWDGPPPGAEGTTPIADAPEWLLDAARRRVPRGAQSSAIVSPGFATTRPAWPASGRSDVPLDRRVYRAREWLRRRDSAIEGSNGSGGAMSAAHVVVIGFDLDVETAIGVMAEWSARCQPPWADWELRKKVVDAAENEPGSPVGFMLDRERARQHHASAHAYAALHASAGALDPDAEERRAIQDEGCGTLATADTSAAEFSAAKLASATTGSTAEKRATGAAGFLEKDNALPQSEAAPPLIEWLDAAEIAKPLPPTPWICPGLQLGPGRPSMVAGYGSAGKTLAIQSMNLSLASGTSIWSCPMFRLSGDRVVAHVDYEQGRHGTIKRYQRLALGMGIDIEALSGRLRFALYPALNLTTSQAYDAFCRAFEGVQFAALDSLRCAVAGVDENDSRIRLYIDVLARVSQTIGCCFLMLHHAGNPFRPPERTSRDGMREPRRAGQAPYLTHAARCS